MAFNGVFPVYNLKFKIGTKGKESTTPTDMAVIKDMETFSLSIDGTVEEWTPMDTAGWARALMTGKKFSVGLNGKRNVGDPGNDYVAATAWKDGLDCSTKGEIEFPDGAKLTYDCVINVKINNSKAAAFKIMAIAEDETIKDHERLENIIKVALGKEEFNYIESLELSMPSYNIIVNVIMAAISDVELEEIEIEAQKAKKSPRK